jgi:hypothetical protein
VIPKEVNIARITSTTLAAALAGVIGGGIGATNTFPIHRSSTSPPIVLNRSMLAQALPVLTLTEQQRLISAVESNKRVKPLMKGIQYKVGGVEAWTTPEGRLIGAYVTLKLANPHTIRGLWTGFVRSCAEGNTEPYEAVSYHAAKQHVTTLFSLVTLNGRRVLSVNSDGRPIEGETSIYQNHGTTCRKTNR